MGFTSELESSLVPIQALLAAVRLDGNEQVARDAQASVTEDLPEAIGFIRSSTRKMDGLINAILKLSREGQWANSFTTYRARSRWTLAFSSSLLLSRTINKVIGP